MILFPIRDMALFDPLNYVLPARPLAKALTQPLPNLTHDFAADACLACRLARHQALRGGDDRNSHSAHHLANVRLAHVAPRTRERDALQIGDHAAAVRGVAQEEAQRLL